MYQTNVSTSTLSIIAAFTTGLDFLRKIRQNRARKARTKGSRESAEELALGKSLRKGPVDIRNEYDRSYGLFGEYIAVGDITAQASLAEILIKMNTGLVSIISLFLTTAGYSILDYEALTDLSDKSRLEAVDALYQLCHRISYCSVALAGARLSHGLHCCSSAPCESCRASVTTRVRVGQAAMRQDTLGSKCPRPHRRQSGGRLSTSLESTTIARVSLRNTSQTQLALVRPRNRRTTSSSSAGSSSSGNHKLALKLPSTAVSTPDTSALPFPLLDQRSAAALRTVAPEQNAIEWKFGQAPLPHHTSVEAQDRWPVQPLSSCMLAFIPLGSPVFDYLTKTSLNASRTPNKPTAVTIPQMTPPGYLNGDNTSADANELRRRAVKIAPSFYSTTTASTKVGEIPMHKWSPQFDYAEMDRLNAEAIASGWGRPGWPVEEQTKEKPRRRFLRMFRSSKISTVDAA